MKLRPAVWFLWLLGVLPAVAHAVDFNWGVSSTVVVGQPFGVSVSGSGFVTSPWMRVWGPGLDECSGWDSAGGTAVVYAAGYYTYSCSGWDDWDSGGSDITIRAIAGPDNPTVSLGGVSEISLGQSVTVTGTLHDPDGNLVMHSLWRRGPRDPNTFDQDWDGWARDADDGTGWSNHPNPGTPSNGTSSTVSGTFTPWALGYWQFHTNGYDADDQWGPGATITLHVVDGTAPSVPASLSASSNTGGTSFTLSWAASTDNVGVTAYEVKRDSTSLGTTTGTSMSITGLSQATTYAMSVRARDAAGNWSSWSSALSVATPDVSAPSTPSGLSSSSNTTGTTFTLNWSASSDNVGVTAYEVRRDSTSLGTTTGTSMSITGLTEITTYSMTVRARDAAGNWSSWSSALSVTTADVTAPSTPTGLSAGNYGAGSFTLSWSASSDNVGVTAYEVRRDSTSLGTTTGTSLSVTGLSSATTYSMTVRARDAAGNWSSWSSALSVSILDINADNDGDGMPNGWEQNHGFNPNDASDAAQDADGDGVSNLSEYLLGTDPRSATTNDSSNTLQLKTHRPAP